MKKIKILALVIVFVFSVIILGITASTNYKYDIDKITVDKDGNLFLITYSKKATSNTTYRTIGWTVKRYDLPIHHKDNNSVIVKIIKDYKMSEPDLLNPGYSYYFHMVDGDKMFEKIKAESEEWYKELLLKGGAVYLDAIMTVAYSGVEKGSLNDNGTYQGRVYFTLSGIQNAEPWGDPTVLYSHFGKELVLKPMPDKLKQKYQIYHYEIINGDYNSPITLRRYGKDISNGKLTLNKHAFQPADFTQSKYEYISAKVMEEVYENGLNTTKQSKTYFGEEGAKISIDNIKGTYKSVTIYFYYNRNLTNTIVSEEFHDPQMQVEICSNEFDVEKGIPTGEELYISASATRYIYNYELENVMEYFQAHIKVYMEYTLKWYENGEQVSEVQVEGMDCIVERPYSYWEINNVYVYGLRYIEVENMAFSDKIVTIHSNQVIPLEFNQIGLKAKHLKLPEYMPILTIKKTIEGGNEKPIIPQEDYQEYAEQVVGDVYVMNDKLVIDNKVILNDQLTKTNGEKPASPPIPNSVSLLLEHVNIPNSKSNESGIQSSGTAFYNTRFAGECREFPIQNINNITIHTPVVNQSEISDDKGFNQKVTPNPNRRSVILDRMLNLNVITQGMHLDLKGYGDREYSKYTAFCIGKFPFDIYIENEKIENNTWVILNNLSHIYVPIWVTEGDYEVELRVIANNYISNADSIDRVEYLANLNIYHYAAVNIIPIQVIGRMYGLAITDILDYPRWEHIFRIGNTMKKTNIKYYVGNKDQNGENVNRDKLCTLPITQGSNDKYPNQAVKLGYPFHFRILTIGDYNHQDYIQIEPRFYYINYEENHRQEVDVYYSETIHNQYHKFVKIGSDEDIMNQKMSVYHSVYGFHKINLNQSSSTIIEHSTINNVENKFSKEWKGEFYLPAHTYIAPKGYVIKKDKKYLTGKEEFWLKEGYIVVNFNVILHKENQKYLSYINEENYKNGYCNMWKVEGFRDPLGIFEYGDMLLYYTDKSIQDDYQVGGTH